uniref:Uncharacterized protein n=1 Tax=Geospiza parvula TaxID=87175 RepID=A0A8C3MDF8_GEOPR
MLGAVAPEQNTSNTKLVSLERDEDDEEEEESSEEDEEEAEAEMMRESQRKLQSVRERFRVLKLKAFIWDYTLKPSSSVETQPREQADCSDDPCTICHEELGRTSCELECGHEFHRECIRTWLLLHSSTCPICREHAVLPADVPARNNSQPHKARPCKRSGI